MKKFTGQISFIVPSKTGYFAVTDVTVFGADRKPFYAAKKGQCFNLPKGIFGIFGIIEILPAPVDYSLAFYPFERDDRNYEKTSVIVCPNRNKASVVFENNTANVFIDPSIPDMGIACLCYVCEHEFAHSHYKLQDGEKPEAVENRCDAYAEHRLIEKGFNPSQIKASNEMLLNSGWRKSECNNRMHLNFSKK